MIALSLCLLVPPAGSGKHALNGAPSVTIFQLPSGTRRYGGFREEHAFVGSGWEAFRHPRRIYYEHVLDGHRYLFDTDFFLHFGLPCAKANRFESANSLASGVCDHDVGTHFYWAGNWAGSFDAFPADSHAAKA